jgi:hypothetical protein
MSEQGFMTALTAPVPGERGYLERSKKIGGVQEKFRYILSYFLSIDNKGVRGGYG